MQWYYSKNGMQMGPVHQADLILKIKANEVSATDLVWKDGMPDWLPAGQVEELGAAGGVESQAPARSTSADPNSPYAAPATFATSGVPVPSSGKATTSMVLGIIGLVFSICACYGGMVSIPCAILAIVFGNQAKTQILQNPHLMPDLGKAKSGILMGWIAIGILVGLTLLAFVFGLITTVSSNSF